MLERFSFSDLRELFAKANEEKSGDQLAGIAARSERERVGLHSRDVPHQLPELGVRDPLSRAQLLGHFFSRLQLLVQLPAQLLGTNKVR